MDNKKQEVLEAAKRIFAQYGYSKSTMSDIGRAVGLNKASLYYHYKDKLALFTAVVASGRGIHCAKVELAMTRLQSTKDQIIYFLLSEIDFSQELSVMFKYGSDFSDGMIPETESVYYQIINEDIKTVETLLNQGIASGEFQSCDTQLIANTLLNTVDALLNNHCPLDQMDTERAKGYLDIKKQVDTLLNLILNGISNKAR